MEIKSLLKKISKNKEEALLEFFNSTKIEYYNMIKMYLLDQKHIEEALSDVYLSIYKMSKKLLKAEDVDSWIKEIIKAVAVKYNEAYPNEAMFDIDNIDFEMDEKCKISKIEFKNALKELDTTEFKIIYFRILDKRNIEAISTILCLDCPIIYKICIEAIKKLTNILK